MALALLGGLTGLVCVVWGFFERSKASSAGRLPRVEAGAAAAGGFGAVDGVIWAPGVDWRAPISQKPCVFFEVVSKTRDARAPIGRDTYGRADGLDLLQLGLQAAVSSTTLERSGGFFVKDATGEVFVWPLVGTLSIEDSDDAASESDGFLVTKTERRLEAGRAVSAMGPFRPVDDVFAILAGGSGQTLDPALVTELKRRAGGAGCACLLGAKDGEIKVIDRPLDEYVEGAGGSGNLLLSVGGLMILFAFIVAFGAR